MPSSPTAAPGSASAVSREASVPKTPLGREKAGALQSLLEGLSREQVAWVSGYLAGLGGDHKAAPAADGRFRGVPYRARGERRDGVWGGTLVPPRGISYRREE